MKKHGVASSFLWKRRIACSRCNSYGITRPECTESPGIPCIQAG